MNMTQDVLEIESLPFWQGAQTKAGNVQVLPFQMVWDERGFLRQEIDQDVMAKVVNQYAEADYGFITALPGLSTWGSAIGNAYAEFALSALSGRSGLRALEIGGGNDFIAQQILSDGKVAHYDLVDPALRLGDESDPRLTIHQKYFDRANDDLSGPYDLILSFNCIEHVPDPVNFLESISAALSEDGIAVIVAPATERQLLNGDFNVLLHEHLSYLTIETVQWLAKNTGLKTVSIEKTDDEFRGVFCLDSKFDETPSVIPCPSWVSDLRIKFEQSLEYADEIIAMPLRRGEVIALHGASNGLNNLLYLLELTDKERERLNLFDGDELKHGSFLSSLTRPILSPSSKEYLVADQLIITAPTYFEAIKKSAVATGWPEDKVISILPALQKS